MNKLIIYICFFWPFVCSCLNIQNVVSLFFSDTAAQLIAYSNLLLLLSGIFFIKRNKILISNTARMWFVFYIIYYGFGLLSAAITGYQTPILASLIPVIYVIGFYFLFSSEYYFKIGFKIITITFILSSITTIIFHHLNFSMDVGGINEWDLDRAGGLYGDANNAALANIITFLFTDKLLNPKSLNGKVGKIALLCLIFYSIFITFSTTGLFTFTIVLFVTNLNFFRGLRIVYMLIAVLMLYGGIFTVKTQTKSLNLTEAQTDKIDNIINVLTLNIDDVDNSGRADLFTNIMYYLEKNPLVGNGVNFAVDMRAHNTYIGIWVDAGLITFLFFIMILVKYMIKALKTENNHKYFIVSCLTVLYVFMISLQTVINQPYLIILFIYLGYLIDNSVKVNHINVSQTK